MTVKYVKGVVQRNSNVNSSVRDIPVYNDNGKVGLVPASIAQYVSEETFGNGVVNRTKLTCTALPISVADDAGVAQYGGVKVYDFPEGMLMSFGAVLDGALTMGATGTFINTYTGVIALGTATASTGSTLTGTEATILQSTAMSTAVAKVADTDAQSIATALTEAGSRWIDGTATAVDMYLNVAIADDATHTAGTGTWTGTIEFVWMVLGDN